MSRDDAKALTAPICLGPDNCAAAMGVNWRWVRGAAKQLGVPLLRFGRKQVVNAEAFLAALANSDAAEPANQAAASPQLLDSAEAVRRALGKKRRVA